MCPSILIYSKLAIRKEEEKNKQRKKEKKLLYRKHYISGNSSTSYGGKETIDSLDIWNMVLVMHTLLAVSICNIHWKVKPKCNDMITHIGTFRCQH
jgi:hypothetical protein